MTGMKRIHSFDEVFDAQKVFRLILTAVANPARIVNIKPFADKLYGDEPGMLAIAMTLLDNEVSFHVCGSGGLSEDIISLTLSKQENPEQADYIFITEPGILEAAIKTAKCGSLQDPHKSATLIIKAEGNRGGNHLPGQGACGETGDRDDEDKFCVLRLTGPGIGETAELSASEPVRTALDIRDGQFYEYPQGIDMIFVSEDGSLFAVPRLIRKEVL
ncbi:MAG TPA: phosphonate C-P lyase system protein PhnH [Anaerovoracaceae bacterium]|nr:phosphonate C-P lyase system protein PhnH [Anaerovoracaceae bacterium]